LRYPWYGSQRIENISGNTVRFGFFISCSVKVLTRGSECNSEASILFVLNSCEFLAGLSERKLCVPVCIPRRHH
jgi:hypothetical protein